MKKTLLSAFIVAGAAIGSGVLALPLVASDAGLLNTLIFITLTLMLSLASSFISLKVYANYDSHDVNAATVAKDYFGTSGFIFTTIVNFLSMGSLAAAYVNVGGDLISHTVLPIFGININPIFGMCIFFVMFIPAFVLGISAISRLNSVIFTIKFISLSVAILLGIKLFNLNILRFSPNDIKYLGSGASTMFCIWMMHMTIPLVLQINDWDIQKSRLAIIIGLLVPASAYVGWLFLIFSMIPNNTLSSITTVSHLIEHILLNPHLPHLVGLLIKIFASITVLTAFLSVGFSLISFTMDAINIKNNKKGRLISTLCSFAIPVIIASSAPEAFLMIYKQSNMFQILAALIPVAAAIKLKNINKLYASITLSLGLVIVVLQILDNMHMLPIK